MPVPRRRLLRLVVALALLGVGPGVSLVDVLVFHSGTAAVAVGTQVDDGSPLLPHGEGCRLALPSAPALDAAPLASAPAAVALAVELPATRSQSVPVTLAARPPPSRAPPLLQA